MNPQLTQDEINIFIEALKEKSTYDFGEYSIKSFTRRIEKLLLDNRTDIDGLINKISKNDSFLEKIVKDITVNTTELFRDPQIWVEIKNNFIPRYKNQDELNIWHAGSSTGQEVYTMLVLLHEAGLAEKSNIFATDLNTDVIEVAQSGKYKYREIDEYVKNFEDAFADDEKKPNINDYLEISKRKSLIKVKPFLYTKPKYKKHNLVSLENPFDTKYDMIFCRNVLIYFNHELQNRIFEFFYDNLHTGGTLVIGRHEGILGKIGAKFEKHGTIYIKK